MAGQEPGVCVDQPQHGAVGAQHRLEAFIRLGLVAGDVGDQRRMIITQHREALAMQLVERLQCAPGVLGAGVGPRRQKDVLDVGLLVAAVPGE